MPVCTDDLDKVIAEVTRKFDGVEEISAELRENVVNYIQRRDILAVLPTGWMENHCCSNYYLAYGVGGKHRTFTSCQNSACSNEFFLQRVDYD